MTVKELHAKLTELINDGRENYPIYFSHGSMSLPISCVFIDKLNVLDVIKLKY